MEFKEREEEEEEVGGRVDMWLCGECGGYAVGNRRDSIKVIYKRW